jgi:hypothetical protein
MRPTGIPLAIALAAVVATVLPSLSQDPPPRHVSASIGIFQYDLSGTGIAPMVAVRWSMPLASVLSFEAGIVGSRPELQGGGSSTFVSPEAQLQLSLPFTGVVPYMGLGLGAAFDLRGAGAASRTDMVISGAVGVRTWVGDRLGLQAEFRGRGIGADFAGSAGEYTAGVVIRR